MILPLLEARRLVLVALSYERQEPARPLPAKKALVSRGLLRRFSGVA